MLLHLFGIITLLFVYIYRKTCSDDWTACFAMSCRPDPSMMMNHRELPAKIALDAKTGACPAKIFPKTRQSVRRSDWRVLCCASARKQPVNRNNMLDLMDGLLENEQIWRTIEKKPSSHVSQNEFLIEIFCGLTVGNSPKHFPPNYAILWPPDRNFLRAGSDKFH